MLLVEAMLPQLPSMTLCSATNGTTTIPAASLARVAGADIGLFKAWEKETGKPNVIVAITDGGIDITHPDLKDNLFVNQKELNGQEGVDDDGNGFIDDINGFNFIHNNGKIYPDDESHGTHVAGTVAARNNNGIGVAGIAGG